ncbi:uncharacterized protein LOC131676627 isoform X2 [Topomyia yanbarensis]|nr:uncharacterized protein LOC131676627 isoform X2 [Topomyia yanbarensis]
MPQFSIVCISLVIVTILVQNASGKRGCAAFGHACYGGHGKRSSSSSLPGESFVYPGGNERLQPADLPSLPYLKIALLDRSKSVNAAPELRPLTAVADVGGGRSGEIFAVRDPLVTPVEQNRYDNGVRFAMNAFLRQLLEGNRAAAFQRQESEAETGSQLINNEQQ